MRILFQLKDYDTMKLKTQKISHKRFNVINGMNGVKYHYGENICSCWTFFVEHNKWLHYSKNGWHSEMRGSEATDEMKKVANPNFSE